MTDVSQTLRRASYGGVTFPITVQSEQGGHSSVAHTRYRTDGADHEPTGRKALKFKFTAALLNGIDGWPEDLWPRVFDDLLAALRRNPQGTLDHPYYGEVNVQIDDWHFELSSKIENGAYLEVECTENNATAYEVLRPEADPGSAMLAEADAADVEVTPLDPLAPSLAPVVAEQLGYLEEEDRSAAEVTAALDVVQQSVRAVLDAPGLAGIEGHGAREAARRTSAAARAYRVSALGAPAPARTYTTPVERSLAEHAALLYGRPDRVDLLRAANTVPDELFVPANTVLVVPDAP